MVEDAWETKYNLWKINRDATKESEADKLVNEEKVQKMQEYDEKRDKEVMEAENLKTFDIKEIVTKRRVIIGIILLIIIAAFIFLLLRK